MSEVKKRSMTLDGHFLKADIYEHASGERRLDVLRELADKIEEPWTTHD